MLSSQINLQLTQNILCSLQEGNVHLLLCKSIIYAGIKMVYVNKQKFNLKFKGFFSI